MKNILNKDEELIYPMFFKHMTEINKISKKKVKVNTVKSKLHKTKYHISNTFYKPILKISE